MSGAGSVDKLVNLLKESLRESLSKTMLTFNYLFRLAQRLLIG